MDSYLLKMLRLSASLAGRRVVDTISKTVKKYDLRSRALKATEAMPSASRQAKTGTENQEDIVDFLFTPDHFRMRESLRKLIDKEINPYVDEWEKAQQFPAHEVFKKLGNAGFLGVHRSPEYGGLGLDYSYALAVAEETGHINCGGVPMAIGVQADMATPALANFGSDELKRLFLAPTISGDFVACVGISEPGAGSDVARLQTNARRSGDDYIINGQKMWITNGMQADWMCILVNTSKEGGPHKNKSLVCLPLNSKGISRTKIANKLGMHSSDTAQFFFDDVRVPAKYMIGEEGMGFMYQMLQFQNERLWGMTSLLTAMERCIQQTADYTKQRKMFGQSLLDFQTVHFRLAELLTEVEALRSLLYRALGRYLKGEDVTKLASMSKLKAGRLAREITDSCVQYYGGMGFTEDCPVTRAYRDMRLISIGAGADEVMLSIISKYMGTMPALPGLKKDSK